MLTTTDIQRLVKALQGIFYTKEALDHKFEIELDPIKDDIKTIKSDVVEIKATVSRIDKRDLEDSNALASTFVGYDKRLKVLEKRH